MAATEDNEVFTEVKVRSSEPGSAPDWAQAGHLLEDGADRQQRPQQPCIDIIFSKTTQILTFTSGAASPVHAGEIERLLAHLSCLSCAHAWWGLGVALASIG